MNSLLEATGTTIFTVMSALAVQHGAINLGQGFPDEDGPDLVVAAAAAALGDASLGPTRNQYPPLTGVPALREAVAAANKRFYGLDIDAQSEVVVTSGATEALTACLMALLNPGDEVVLIEPTYDIYVPVVKLLGAVPKLVRLEPPAWELPRAAMAAAFSPRTKLLLLNSPMNPTGKVFGVEDLDFIADLCVRHDTYAVCDEVYEHLVFDDAAHIPLMTRPGMRDRCARIGSAGKTFSLTGWKVGYVSAPRAMASVIAKAHQNLTFTTPPHLQRAVAAGLAQSDDYFAGIRARLAAKRTRLARGLAAVGFVPLETSGSYFVTADFSGLGFDGDDVAFCRWMVEQAGVVAIPVSAFYTVAAPRHYVRFAFCKQDALLDEAIERLARHFAPQRLTRSAQTA
jgi:aspartate/methionine/tyrosine aminotransferase